MALSLTTAGGALWPILSRRAGAFALAALAVWVAPLPADTLQWWGRVVLCLLAAWLAMLVVSRLLPAPMLPLHRRAVLVTGCSSGFGQAAALALDAAGAHVVAAVRTPDAPGTRRLVAQASSRMRVVRMDVTDDASVAAAVAAVRQALGDNELWAVVNNAGSLGVGECEWLDMDHMKSILDVNTFGTLRVIRAFLPMLRESKGRIVNMISILCRCSLGGVVPYCVSKYATLALTEALRHEVRRFGVSVHSLEPWFYETPLLEQGPTKFQEAWDKAPDHVKDAYGQDYISRMQNTRESLLSLLTLPARKVHVVSEAVIDACFARDPQVRYIPSLFAEFTADLTPFGRVIIAIMHNMFLPRFRHKSL
ncbi:hypothetical protein R5R35_007595 [Gryllus longicercus]|uniref:Uncharacterized protein n=1 Tax=Gryllus longicercus TaxID=2509291 RepID=A0AAN9ZEN8_9ORTH